MIAKKDKELHIWIVVIGSLLISMSSYGLIVRGSVIDHLLNLTLGVSLVGVGLMKLYPSFWKGENEGIEKTEDDDSAC